MGLFQHGKATLGFWEPPAEGEIVPDYPPVVVEDVTVEFGPDTGEPGEPAE